MGRSQNSDSSPRPSPTLTHVVVGSSSKRTLEERILGERAPGRRVPRRCVRRSAAHSPTPAFRSQLGTTVRLQLTIWTIDRSDDSHGSRGFPEHSRSYSPRHFSTTHSHKHQREFSIDTVVGRWQIARAFFFAMDAAPKIPKRNSPIFAFFGTCAQGISEVLGVAKGIWTLHERERERERENESCTRGGAHRRLVSRRDFDHDKDTSCRPMRLVHKILASRGTETRVNGCHRRSGTRRRQNHHAPKPTEFRRPRGLAMF